MANFFSMLIYIMKSSLKNVCAFNKLSHNKKKRLCVLLFCSKHYILYWIRYKWENTRQHYHMRLDIEWFLDHTKTMRLQTQAYCTTLIGSAIILFMFYYHSFLWQYVIILSGSEYVLFFYRLFIYVLPLEIQLSIGGCWDPIKPHHICVSVPS